jgi:hypothetical protein
MAVVWQRAQRITGLVFADIPFVNSTVFLTHRKSVDEIAAERPMDIGKA